jgi:mannose-6-phosphate isomerase-like protein (cupin superfamily)
MSTDATEHSPDLTKMSPEEKDAFHRSCEARIETFSYKKPGPNPKREKKDWVDLCASTLSKTLVQIVKDGGENNLHYHRNSDTVWFVLSGRVRYYGPGDVLIGEFGKHEGIVIPGGSRYWFEKAGDEDLEILQINCKTHGQKSQRINLDSAKGWMKEDFMHVYEEAK